MTISPGTPTFTPPAYSVPAFASGSVALGATVTTVKLESVSGTAQTTLPFRFGQVFKAGDLAPSAFLVGKISGQADVLLQFNPLATHPDGSVRHAVIAGVLPNLAAGATVSMALVRASTGASTAAITPASFSGLAASVALDFAGTAYTANAGPAIAALAANQARIPGVIATEYNVMVAPVTAGGTPHPDLEVRFDVVYFPGASAFKVDVTFEHTKAFSTTGDLTYSGTIQIGGATAYTLPSPLTHFPHARWKRTYWINNAAPLVARPDRDYWIDSKAVVNYDRRVTVSEATLAAYETQAADPAFAPMGNGIFTKAMGTTGGRPDIGLLPGYAAGAVLSMDKRAIKLTKAGGDIAGSWGIHVRDTSNGPGKGMVMSCVNWPYATGNVNAVVVNPDTGQSELIPFPATSSQLSPDDSHTPNFAYLPYLLTGDLFYLEEMQFWSNGIFNNPMYRQKEKGLVQKTQIRGQAWSLRGILECAAFTPDAHPLKSHFKYWVDSNIANYDAMYTNNPDATPLGCLSDYNNFVDLAYSFGGTKVGIGLYQDDFFTSVIGHAVELGYTTAAPLLHWKAKFQIGRMLAPGFCYINACPIALCIKETAQGPTYATLAECQAASVGGGTGDNLGTYTQAIHNAPCNSQQRLDLMNAQRIQPSNPFVLGEIIGYANGTEGYPSNYQGGLALAVDSGYTDGDLAWDLFESRTVMPDYGTSPQFAVVPRGVVATTPSPTPPTNGIPMSFDRIKTTTTTTGTGNITVSATAATRYLPLGSVPIGTSLALVIEDENGTDWEESYCTVLSATTFSRDTVIKGSNGQNKVNFSASTKTVYAVLTADQVNAFLTSTSLLALGTSLPDYLAANPGSTPNDTDALPFVQGTAVVGQQFGATATAINKRAVKVVDEIITIAATAPVTLDVTVHNRRRVVCTAAATLAAPSAYASVGDGFSCKVTNLSGAAMSVTGITILPAGTTTIPTGGSADVFAVGGSVYAELRNAGAAGGTITAPGQVTGLTAGTATSTTQPLSWTAPTTGTAPFTYLVEKSADGGSTWTNAATGVSGTSTTVSGLTAATSYKYRVSAVNSANTGPASTAITASTAAAAASTITVANPASPQTVGTPFIVSGTWTGTQPTAIDYQLADNGTPGAWTAAPTPTINANGTWSFSQTPASASTSRTIAVRDHNATSVVSAASGAYVVNAAAAGGTAPFTLVAQAAGDAFSMYSTIKTFTGDYWPQRITATGTATIVSTHLALAESTSTTVPPTSSISMSNAVGSRGVWLDPASNYNNTGVWIVQSGTRSVGTALPTAITMRLWAFITDSNGVTWTFVYPFSVQVGDSVTNTQLAAEVSPTQVQ